MLVFGSMYQGKPFWGYPIVDPLPKRHEVVDLAPRTPQFSDSDSDCISPDPVLLLAGTGLLKRYILQPFETWLFPPKCSETTIYRAVFRCTM